MTEEKAKSLIGRKVRGFKFESERSINYDKDMDDYIGRTGVIDGITKYGNFLVDFTDNFFVYPASLIEAHLVEESIDRKISDFKETESIVESDLIQINPSEYSCKFANMTASELINQNEQLKAENAELVEAVKNLYNLLYDAHYNCNNELTPFPTRSALDNAKQTIEKHGK